MQEIRNGKKSVLHLCLECASKKALPHGSLLDNLDLSELMKMFETEMDQDTAKKEQPVNDPFGPCPVCMWRAEDLYKTGLFGCPACYTHFKKLAVEKLLELSNSTIHAGRVPDYSSDLFPSEQNDEFLSLAKERAAGEELARRIEELEQDIEGSIRREEYELAAQLRDRLQLLLTKTR